MLPSPISAEGPRYIPASSIAGPKANHKRPGARSSAAVTPRTAQANATATNTVGIQGSGPSRQTRSRWPIEQVEGLGERQSEGEGQADVGRATSLAAPYRKTMPAVTLTALT